MTIKETVDFLFYLIDTQNREEFKEIWLSKEIDMSLSDFIEKNMNQIKQKTKTQSLEKDKKAIELAENIMSMPINEGGG